MSNAYMATGQMIEWNNTQFKLDRLIDDEWQMLNAKTQKACHITVKDFFEKYVNGEIQFFNKKSNNIPESLPQKNDKKIVEARLTI